MQVVEYFDDRQKRLKMVIGWLFVGIFDFDFKLCKWKPTYSKKAMASLRVWMVLVLTLSECNITGKI